MNDHRHVFPFGTERTGTPPRKPLVTPATAFVIGVYPSAVHARWTVDAKVMSGALAVAPEPYSFWDGSGGAEIVQAIAREMPRGAGILSCNRGLTVAPDRRSTATTSSHSG